MLDKQIKIRGNIISVYRPSGRRVILFRRKIVEPEWVKLWYDIQEDKFDESLWLRLNDVDRQFLAFCLHYIGFHNKDLNIHLAKDQQKHFDQLRIIEGEVLAGNLNDNLVDQYDSIVSMLQNSLQIERKHGTLLKNRMRRTFMQQKQNSAST